MINQKNDEMAAEAFLNGTDFGSYRYLGFHIVPDDRGEKYAVFRVWAPNAKEIFLVGDFNGWEETHPMVRNDFGIFEASLPASIVRSGQNYKFKITTMEGKQLFKADPYALFSETPPATASKIFISAPFGWHDGGYLADRKKLLAKNGRDIPLNIYKLDLSGWKRKDSHTFQKYREIADELIPYVKQMGYTHIELVSIAEHMSENLPACAITGFFAPTSRHGTPDDFRSFVDALHCAGLGVLTDLSFAKIGNSEHGLMRFDGTPIYEHSGDDDDCIAPTFDLSRGEVTSFLLSNAIFWIEEFHIDGLVADLSEMLRDNSDCAVFSFFKTLSSRLSSRYPDIITVAKAPSRIANAAEAVCDGGLGFSYVRDRRLEKDILLRADLSFGSRLSAAAKNGITALSDSTGFIVGIGGEDFEKFSKSRLALSCMMLSASKKLMYMGTELAQLSDSSQNGSVDWHILGDQMHKKHQLFVRDLGFFYLSHPILWQDGGTAENPTDGCDDLLSFFRINAKGTAYKELIAAINFGKNALSEVSLRVPRKGCYRKVFSSALSVYGGNEESEKISYKSCADSCRNYYIKTDLAPISVSVFEPIGEDS